MSTRLFCLAFCCLFLFLPCSAQEPQEEEMEIEEILDVEVDELEEVENELLEVTEPATFRVAKDSFEVHDLRTETGWPSHSAGESLFKERQDQILVFDFTGGLNKGVALGLLKPYLSYLEDGDIKIILCYTDEDVSDSRINQIKKNLKNGLPNPKNIQVWLHKWPDGHIGIQIVNPNE